MQTPGARRFGARSMASRVVLAAALVAGLVTVPSAAGAAPADPCGAGSNPVVCENSKPGTPAAVWDISGAGDPSIQGFATQMSVNVGGTIGFKIDSTAAAYTIDIYRTGWYGGDGARKIASVAPTAALPQHQPACMTDPTTQLYDCGNWGLSASWAVPATAVSGVYVALLHRTDTGGESHIIFVVRNDASTSDVVFQTSDTTWQAYNTYGGASFYTGASSNFSDGSQPRAFKLSYNRPFATREGVTSRDFYFSSEYAMVRFAERNGYDVSYIAGADTARSGSLLLNHKVFLSVGHDEYWSGAQRANVEAARDAGVNLAFFSGNEIYWRTRWEPSIAGTATDYRTLVSYKETWSNQKVDPSAEWTGTWRDPRFASQADGGGRPENGLSGTLYMSNFSDLPVTVSDVEGKLRLWRGTGLDTQAAGASTALAAHTVGYESDEDLDNGARPAGLIRLSTTTGAVPEYLQDYGNTTAAGTTTHHLTQYKAPSGALVFSAGSIQWAWGLDATHDGDGAPADSRMQQATVNLLADMSAQPVTLMAGLVAASKSTDTTAPTASVTSPVSGASIANGTLVTATGTAADVGGRVAGVEVSTDGGATWHPASGTTSWTYSYVQTGSGAASVRARAVDDSSNIGPSSTASSLTVSCPCSIFGAQVPTTPATTDSSAVELGLRFTPTVNGFVTGVRFYKGTGNGGTHTGTLWSAGGTALAQVTFAGESTTGWQQATFAQAVAVTAGTLYTVSYTAPQGHYAAASNAFYSAGIEAPPLRVAGGFGAQVAGVYSTPGTFPTTTFGSSNYYVDAMFDLVGVTPLTIVGRQPLDGATSVGFGATVSAVLSKDVVASTVSATLTPAGGASVPGATSYDAPSRTVTFTPAAALNPSTVYTAAVAAKDSSGASISGPSSWTFTTAVSGQPGGSSVSFYDDTATPAVLEEADPGPVTLGVRFSSAVAGTVDAIRFYKGPNNTGTHVGSLWRVSDGALLGTVTFTGESTTGWQTARFTSPVAIAAGTEYIASYRAPVGRYSTTVGAFASPGVNRAPLSTSVDSGAYTYATGYPDAKSSTSYFVDVLFTATGNAPLAVVSRSPVSGAVGVASSSVVSVSFNQALATGASVGLTAGGVAVAGSSVLSADRATVTFTPAAALAASTVFTARASGLVAASGSSLADVSWSFTTAAASGCPCSLFADQTPVTAADSDTVSVELGVSFVPAVAGQVTGVRFYKGVGNGGTHTGSLWSAAGARLATVTFTGETASGWQTASFATPVSVTAGTTYVVSYLAPQGRYSSTSSYFASARTVGPLTAPAAGNGRYVYGSGFPTSTWQSTNYFVDVVFQEGTPAPLPTVSSTSPAAGATGVVATSTVSAVLSAVPASTPTVTVTSPSGAVAGSTAWNATSRTVTFTPSAALTAGTVISAVVAVGGTALSGGTWSFTVAGTPPPTPLAVVSRSPVSGAVGVASSSVVSVSFNQALATGASVGLTAGGVAVAGSSVLSADRATVTFTPAAALAASTVFTARASGLVAASGSSLADVSWSFTTAAASGCPCSLFADQTPVTAADSDTVSVELGVSFVPAVAGQVTGVRFYKGVGNGGTHTGSLWSAAGARLATVTFTGETASGWQTASFATPVSVTAGTTYVVSYLAPQGRYSSTSSYFASARTVGPLTAPAAGNGRYVYGSGFPTSTWQSTNYFVDVVFQEGTPAPLPTVSSTSPAAGATGVVATSTVSAVLSAVPASTPTVTVTSPSGAVAGSTAWNATSRTVTFTPSAALTAGTVISAVVAVGGTALSGGTWSFTVAGTPPPTPLAVVSRSPVSGAVGVASSSVVSVSFNQALATGASVGLTAGGVAVAGSSVLSADRATVTFTPAAALAASTVFTARASGLVAASGSSLADVSWSFTTAAASGCPCSLFADQTPVTAADSDTVSVELGVSFVPAVAGQVTGVRFYKGVGNGGTHTGSLWSAAGARLATVTFTGETASGWQTASFATPVSVTAGTTYVVSYLAPQGRYSSTSSYFASARTVGPLTAPAAGNGRYVYGSGFPTSTWQSTNYFVDVVFSPAG